MWTPNKDKLVKVRLHSKGEDGETPWAEDLGPDPKATGARLVRLANIPFFHAKPTFGDVISAVYEDDFLTWDSQGLGYDDIVEQRIVEDSGRWAMIIDYEAQPNAEGSVAELFSNFAQQSETLEFIIEGYYANSETRKGRAYLAIPSAESVESAFNKLKELSPVMTLTLVHPVDDEEED